MKSGTAVPIFSFDQIEVLHAAFVIVCGRLGLKPGDRAAEDVDVATSGVCDVEGLTVAAMAQRDIRL